MKILQHLKNKLREWLKCTDPDTILELYKKMHTLAYYDSLTELPNRLMFQEVSTQALETAKKDIDSMALFLIDLDNFKHINDTHGHLIGDEVLKTISKRLKGIIEAHCALGMSVGRYETCKCIISRLGGDEFVVLLEKVDRPSADIAAQLIVQELKEPIMLTTELRVSASVGVALYPWDGQDMHNLLKSADLAMYAAKEQGKNQYCFHEKAMNTKIERKVEAEQAICQMLEHQQVKMFFQPIISSIDQKIVGAEALLRGTTTDGKYINPMELIEAAEDANLIIPLSDIILKKSLEFVLECRKHGYVFPVSVNVSARQLLNVMFPEQVLDTLDLAELPASSLILEITETTLISDFGNSARMLNHLSHQGIQISIDDFGKGYSSFNYLQQLPINKIKIDMAFIHSIATDSKAAEIVKAIVLMTEALGMTSCAEGVETLEQFKKLQEFGCDQIQGYYKSPALSPEEFIVMLQKDLVDNTLK